MYLKEKDPKFVVKKFSNNEIREGLMIKEAKASILRKMDQYRTGEVKHTKGEGRGIGLSIFSNIYSGEHPEDNALIKGMVKLITPSLNAQGQEMFVIEDEKYHKDQLS
jgi:hypothetical protein